MDGPKLALEDTDDHVAYEYEVIDAIANCADRCILCAKNVEDHVTCFQVSGYKSLVCLIMRNPVTFHCLTFVHKAVFEFSWSIEAAADYAAVCTLQQDG